MDTKGSQSPSTTNLSNVLSEDGIVYIAVKGSLHANDSSVFGLGQEEIKALIAKFPGSGVGVVNGIIIKANVLKALNSLCQLGYKITSSTGETEITWTLQQCNHANCGIKNTNKSVCQTISEMDWERGLWNAAFSGDEEKVNILINKARNAKEIVNTPDNAGYSPLHYAARNGHVNICDKLIKNGACVDAETKSGKATPLHKAAAAGQSDTVQFLIQSGALVIKQDIDGQTALHKAIQNRKFNLVEILTKACPQITSVRDNKGNLPSDLSSD